MGTKELKANSQDLCAPVIPSTIIHDSQEVGESHGHDRQVGSSAMPFSLRKEEAGCWCYRL
jgi:hypothetical protein